MEDAKIIELFFQRNEQAVKETDTAYGRKLYVLSNNILNNREDAEESVSDTYMETWKSILPNALSIFMPSWRPSAGICPLTVWTGGWHQSVTPKWWL